MKTNNLAEILLESKSIFPDLVEHTLIDQLRTHSIQIQDKELERELKRMLKAIDYALVSTQLTPKQRQYFKRLRKVVKNAL
jgi:hypothetical protein